MSITNLFQLISQHKNFATLILAQQQKFPMHLNPAV